jgi:hypothetical protein
MVKLIEIVFFGFQEMLDLLGESCIVPLFIGLIVS